MTNESANLTALEKLHQKIDDEGIILRKKYLTKVKALALVVCGIYGISYDPTKIANEKEEYCILYHEYYHLKCGILYNVNTSKPLIRHLENKANREIIQNLVPLDELLLAIKKGYIEKWDLAEYFDVVEEVIELAYNLYEQLSCLKKC